MLKRMIAGENGGGLTPLAVWIILGFLVLVGILRIAATYPVLSQTLDEPASIACGMEWLDRGTYTYEPVHPPLARVMTAVGPYLRGGRATEARSMWKEGNNILHFKDTYWKNLALARLGILPFFILGSVVVFLWTRAVLGQAVALVSVGFFTTLPPILAHSGFATLDMALASTVLLALYAYQRFVKNPCFRRAIFFGAACGLAILTKFTAGVILAIALLSHVFFGALLAVKRNESDSREYRPRSAVLIGAAILAVTLTLWAGYRFSFGPVVENERRPFTTMGGTVRTPTANPGIQESTDKDPSILEGRSWPAPELLQGIRHAKWRDSSGSFAYLFGEIKRGGWWYYYPSVILYKTPLPFLLLMIIGITGVFKQKLHRNDLNHLMMVVYPVVILLAFLPSQVNNGVRQILVIYGFLSILAALGAVSLFGSGSGYGIRRGLIVGLAAWHMAGGIAVHPDYVAYFNELAGNRPEEVLVESDLDWGQDLGRLVRTVNDMGIEEIALKIATTADLSRFPLPKLRNMNPGVPVTGWIAISYWRLKFYNTDGGAEPPYGWLEEYTPERRVGTSILLFNIP